MVPGRMRASQTASAMVPCGFVESLSAVKQSRGSTARLNPDLKRLTKNELFKCPLSSVCQMVALPMCLYQDQISFSKPRKSCCVFGRQMKAIKRWIKIKTSACFMTFALTDSNVTRAFKKHDLQSPTKTG